MRYDNSKTLNQELRDYSALFENIEQIIQQLDKSGFLGDFWLLSTSLRLSKALLLQAAIQFKEQLIPFIPFSPKNVVSIIPASKTAKILLVIKKNPKILPVINRFNSLKQQEFESDLERELQKIPEDTPASIIQDFKTFFANTQQDWDRFLKLQERKKLDEEGKRKLEVQRARQKEKLMKEQMKHQLDEFEEVGGYEAIEQDQIERVRKKALPAKKPAKKASFSPEIEEKIEHKKRKDELRAESEDRTQKFFAEKKKLQQDYMERLKKLKDKRKG
jgi:hypothetical protein